MNTAAGRMVAAAGASRGQESVLASECTLDGFDRPVAAERPSDAAAEPMVRADEGANAGIDDGIELVQAICRDMHACGEVCILLTGSAPRFLPARYHPAYGRGRPGINSFSWVLKRQLKDTGITAISVVPGMEHADFLGGADEPTAKIAADVSAGWNKLRAAAAAFTVWAAAFAGFDRT